MQAGQLAEAERLCRAILATAPNDSPAIHLLGFIAHRAGRHDEAIDLIGEAIALDENNPDCHFNIGADGGRKARRGGDAARARSR